MKKVLKVTLVVCSIGAVLAAISLYLYSEALDDEHEALVSNQVEVVRAARSISAGTPLTKDRVVTERIPTKFLPPKPLLESELGLYLGTPLATHVEEGAMVLTTDFSHSTVDSSAPDEEGEPTSYGEKGRLVVKNATLSLQSDHPEKTLARLMSIAEQRGGFVVSSSLRDVHFETEAGMKARIPSDEFDETLRAFRGEGVLLQENVTGQDVTDKYVDLDAQLRNQQALEDRLREILSDADTVESAMKVEERMTAVRTETDRLEGRIRHLRSSAALSTVEVVIALPRAEEPVVEESQQFDPIVDAFSDSADTLVRTTATLIRLVVAALPFLLFAGPIVYAAGALWRRRRRTEKPSSPE